MKAIIKTISLALCALGTLALTSCGTLCGSCDGGDGGCCGDESGCCKE